jgi:hypothetical protein
MKNQTQQEGRLAKAIETQTSKIPSDVFLWSGLGLFAISIVLQTVKQKHAAILVSQFGTSFLLMGVYNKLVKQQGHDQDEKNISQKQEHAVY